MPKIFACYKIYIMKIHKLVTTLFIIGVFGINCLNSSCHAGYYEHYTKGQQLYYNAQYSSAIDEFKQALSQRQNDNSSRIGLINSYLARGTYLANYESNYKEASNDFRSALYYLKYYVENDVAMNSLSSISSAANSLKYCEKQYGADLSPAGHMKTAKELDELGNYAAAIYEYEQIINQPAYRQKALERIASMMAITKNYNKSSEYYKLVIDTNPDDIMVRLRYANVLDKLGDTKGASEQYNFVLSHCDNNPELLCDLERIYNKKLAESPTNADLLADLGAIKQRQGKYTEAYEYYNRSQSQSNRSMETAINTQLNMGTLLQVQGKYEKAIEIYKKIIIMQPNHYEANLYLAQCYESLPDCKKQALQQYKKLQSLKPSSPEFNGKISELTRESMGPEDIYNYVKSVIAPDKYYVEQLYKNALTEHEQKNYPTAIKYYELVKYVDPTNSEVYENLAVCYAQQKDYAKAKDVLNTAQTKFPNNTKYSKLLKDINDTGNSEILMKAYESYNNKDYQTAITLYSSISDKTTDVWLGLAGAYQNSNQPEKAIECYNKALELSPNNSDIAYSIGAIWVNLKNYQKAKTYFQKAVTINPNNISAKEALLDMKEVISQTYVQDAVALIEHQQNDDAIKLLNQALQENPNNPDAYYYRASIYDTQTKYALAIEDYKKSLKFNPNQPVTNYLIAIDYENLNNIKNALEYYQKFIKSYTQDDEYSQYVKARIPEIENELKNGAENK